MRPLGTRTVFLEDEILDSGVLAHRVKEGIDVKGYLSNSLKRPLDVAAENNCVESCRILLKAGADANVGNGSGRVPLGSAAIGIRKAGYDEGRTREIAALLLAHGADPNGVGLKPACLPIYEAASAHNVPMMMQLIEAGAEPNPDLIFNGSGRVRQLAMIEHLFEIGRDKSVAALLRLGVDDSRLRHGDLTPFQNCVRKGLDDTVRYYIAERREDIMQRTHDGKTMATIARKASTRALLRSLKTGLVVANALGNQTQDSKPVLAPKRDRGMAL